VDPPWGVRAASGRLHRGPRRARARLGEVGPGPGFAHAPGASRGLTPSQAARILPDVTFRLARGGAGVL